MRLLHNLPSDSPCRSTLSSLSCLSCRPMPPSYGLKQYWDTRFEKEESFEWLLGADALDTIVSGLIQQYHRGPHSSHEPRILHIGCGNSDLSFRLRRLVTSPSQITNVDYSVLVVEKGSQKERVQFGSQTELMGWRTVDLRSPSCPQELVPSGSCCFDFIFDKSTADSIACGEDISVELPYQPHAPLKRKPCIQDRPHSSISVDPLHMLAVNLAAMTTPGTGHWIVVSYSEDRFPFLSETATTKDSSLASHIPDPRRLWTLERKERLVVPEAASSTTKTSNLDPVYRPETAHWLYVLVRTNS